MTLKTSERMRKRERERDREREREGELVREPRYKRYSEDKIVV